MTHLGCRVLDVNDPIQDARVPVRLLYPTSSPASPHRFGPYTIDLAVDAPVDEVRAVVVISHGTGGTPWGYRGLTAHLVGAGFAIVLVEHPGNSRADNRLEGTAANLGNRPRHLRLALDAALAVIDRPAAVIGHSLGGYTALAVAGGHPMTLPRESPDGVGRPVLVEPDPRVRAVVLLAPALPWLMSPGALADVHVPVLVRTGERDEVASPALVEHVLRSLPADARLDYQVVPGAGHFAFFAPVPEALAGLPPALDPPGFDRAGYQPQLYAEVEAFLRAALSA